MHQLAGAEQAAGAQQGGVRGQGIGLGQAASESKSNHLGESDLWVLCYCVVPGAEQQP